MATAGRARGPLTLPHDGIQCPRFIPRDQNPTDRFFPSPGPVQPYVAELNGDVGSDGARWTFLCLVTVS